ncbi:MAG: succinylglutamate desuccinylase/aspartoacylase family protein [Deltaproteobacteria bacterium]|nr:succinylglutamate desuccinylase/aspartoacylase family protein [Deltaproteobacteria bacterium]
MKIDHESVLTLQLPYRERFELRRTVFQGGDGPKVAVVSGIHGDELEGIYVCHRLAEWLEKTTALRPDALRGRVELYPALNPLGIDTLERSVPVYDTDLNRNFPGHPEGLLPQRLAAAVMNALAGASLVIDVHASNIFLREIPQVRINQEFAASLVPLARTMNLDVVWLHGALTVLEATIAHSLNARGIPCLVVEMGVGMRVTPAYSDQLLVGILNTWQALGVLDPGLELPKATHEPLIADDSNVHYLNAATSGLFIPEVAHWISVFQGQILGRIVSPHEAGTLSEVRSPVNGVLFTLREYPIVYEGSLMARIMAIDFASMRQEGKEKNDVGSLGARSPT